MPVIKQDCVPSWIAEEAASAVGALTRDQARCIAANTEVLQRYRLFEVLRNALPLLIQLRTYRCTARTDAMGQEETFAERPERPEIGHRTRYWGVISLSL